MSEIQNNIWEKIFSFLKPISDNIGFIVITCSLLFAIVLILIKKVCHCKLNLGIIDYFFMYSLGHAVIQLPNIHHRINLALKTISGIIANSSVYTESFKSATGMTSTNAGNIASFLYNLPKEKRFIFSDANPYMLYEHCFSTMDKIKDLYKGETLTEACFGSLSVFFILSIIIIICTINKEHWIQWAIQSTFLLYANTVNSAMVLSFICIFVTYWTANIIISRKNFKNELKKRK